MTFVAIRIDDVIFVQGQKKKNRMCRKKRNIKCIYAYGCCFHSIKVIPVRELHFLVNRFYTNNIRMDV